MQFKMVLQSSPLFMYALTFQVELNHGFKLLTGAALFDLLLQGPFL